MKIVVDLTETLKDWTEFLSDLQCDLEDVRSSVRYYDPMDSSLFLDELIESDCNSITDDVIEVIQNTATILLRGRIDAFMSQMGFELRRIIDVFMTSLTSSIFAIVDVIHLRPIGEVKSEYTASRHNGGSSTMVSLPRLISAV